MPVTPGHFKPHEVLYACKLQMRNGNEKEDETEKQLAFLAASTAMSTSFEDPAATGVMTFPVAFWVPYIRCS
jgi:hypothetical protein